MPNVDEQLSLFEFSADDFDAYKPEKWNSNMFTLDRRKVKNKLENWGNELQRVMESESLPLVMHLSDEFPSLWNKKLVDRQWLFFSRDERAREEITALVDRERTLADTLADPTPLYRHLFLGASVSDQHIEIGIWLHYEAWVDRKNFLSLSADAARRSALIGLIAELPPHFEIGLVDSELSSPAGFGEEALYTLTSEFESRKGWLFLGARLPRDQALVLGDDIIDTACEVFQQLIPIYQLIAWSPSNDAISIDRLVAERNEMLRQTREELDKERAQREAKLREKEALGLAFKEQIADKIRETDAWRSREIAARRALAARVQTQAIEEDARARAEAMAAQWGLAEKKDGQAAENRIEGHNGDTVSNLQSQSDQATAEKRTEKSLDHQRLSPAKPQPAPSEPEDADQINVRDVIEVIKGFLKGRRGTVQEIDEKGGIKVVFGVLSSRLEQSEVKGLGRIPLDSRQMSHAQKSRLKSRDRHQDDAKKRFRATLPKE